MQNQQATTPLQQEGPLISFIVTTYNMPTELLRECLESIGALGLKDEECEIVLVDDGSEVTPLAELSDWQDRLVYLRQQNCGLSVARNNGLRIARGRYVQFVDADDCLLSVTYSQCLKWAEEHDADIMLFALNKGRGAKDKGADDIAVSGPMTGAAYLHNNNLRASACGYLFKRLMLDNLRFTPGIYHEDEEFTPLLLLKADQLYYTDAEAYFYRQRSESITHQADETHTRKRLEDMRNIIYRLQKTSATIPEGERVALSRRVAQLSMDYLYQTIRLTHSKEALNAAIKHLEVAGLFPLPDKSYSKKYSMFRRLVGNAAGRRLLLMTI